MDLKISPYVCVHIKQYPENFAFLIQRTLELITGKFVNLLKSGLIFNIFFCAWMFVNKGYAKPSYEPQWATMNHNEPKWPKMTHKWPKTIKIVLQWPKIMYQNLLFSLNSSLKYVFGQIWSRNSKVLCLKWNSIQRGIQGCWFWIQKLFSKISSLKYLFWANLIPKLQSALFRMKIRTKSYSGVLIPNSTFVFLSSVPKISLLGKFCPATSKYFV